MIYLQVKEVADFISSKTKFEPQIGLVLGSGLGDYADKMEDKITLGYDEIPHFHKTTVLGHEGRLVLGKVNDVKVAAFQGRFHAYEGYQQTEVVLPVRVLAQLGAKFVILTNASGGINEQYRPGDLVNIIDHINLTGRNPLLGSNDDRVGPRFPDMSYTYDPKMIEAFKQSADELGVTLHQGVYAGVLGPAYETPAEIRMLRTLGADIVGMSTVPESIAAHHAGLRVGGVACVTNMAAGMLKDKLDHNDVKDVANKAKQRFADLLTASIEKISKLK